MFVGITPYERGLVSGRTKVEVLHVEYKICWIIRYYNIRECMEVVFIAGELSSFP